LFAVVSVCVNLAYYALHGVNLFNIAALPAWLISIALPSAIARYSHLIVDAAHVAHSNVPEFAQDEAQQDSAQSAKSAQDEAQVLRKTERKRWRKSAPKMSAEQRRLHILEAGYDSANVIAEQFGVSLRTAQNDLAAVRLRSKENSK
jgi:DNA-directed RNA polymerase specialized sigma24 family protein